MRMKQFFKMMFASALGVFLAVGVMMLLSLFVVIVIVSSVGSRPAYSPKAGTVFKIRLDGILSDYVNDNPLAMLMGDGENKLALNDLLASIRKAKVNGNIEGIYLESGNLITGSASLKEIREALEDFKESGKFVVAYADNYSQGNYYLCSVADKVFLNPQGMLGVVGLASQTLFYKGLLDKIGVDMQVFKVGTYKGAVEPFMLDKLSDANREQIQSYLGSVWQTLSEGMASSRNISLADVNHFANEGLAFASPDKAVECGLVDALKYRPEAEKYIRELAGQTDKKLRTADLNQFKNLSSGEKEKKDRIAVLFAEGEIMPDSPASPYDMEQRITEKMAAELIKLKNDDEIKAVVFRVNSPGGSAFVSEQIWRQVVELKQVKPVVVSMGNVAASGGYYISCGADKIVAEPNTLTGSIGIFGIFPNVSGLFHKLALSTDLVKTNTFADLGDMSRPMTADEKALLQGYVERGYETFIDRCARGRGMTPEAIDAVGQGRVWTGRQALEKGLVDELGGIDTAIRAAASLAGLSDYSVREVAGSKDFVKDWIEKQWGEVRSSIVQSVLGDEYEYFQKIQTVKSAAGIQARLPYDVNPL